MKIQESGENYLETMLILKKQKGYIKSIDIANMLSFSKPSVSRAVSVLKQAGHIVIDEDGHNIELTESGMEIAQRMYDRHEFLTKFLTSIGVSKEVASSDACRMEHVISEETFKKLEEHVEKNK